MGRRRQRRRSNAAAGGVPGSNSNGSTPTRRPTYNNHNTGHFWNQSDEIAIATTPVRSISVGTGMSPHNRTLKGLCEMFGRLDADLITTLYMSFGGNVDRVITYILSMESDSKSSDGGCTATGAPLVTPPTGGSADPLCTLPSDALLCMCEFLDLFELGRLSSASRGCYTVVLDTCSSVRYLNLAPHRHWPDWKLLLMMSKFPAVQSLSLRACGQFNSFDNMPAACMSSEVTHLNLSGCKQLTDGGLARVLQCVVKLTSLDVSSTFITDSGLIAIVESQLPIARLCLTDCKYISDVGLAHILKSCPSLRGLTLNKTYVSSGALNFGAHSSPLEFLSLSNCHEIRRLTITSPSCVLQTLHLAPSPTLLHVELNIRTLRSLRLSGCKSLLTLKLRAPALQELQLTACRSLKEATVNGITSLSDVNLYQCRELTGASVRSLAGSAGGKLERLVCAGCMGVGEETAMFVMEHCDQLEVFDISACKSISELTQKRVKDQLQDRVSAKGSKLSLTAFDVDTSLISSLSPV